MKKMTVVKDNAGYKQFLKYFIISFFLIIVPAWGSNQTSFLTLQGILQGSATLQALF